MNLTHILLSMTLAVLASLPLMATAQEPDYLIVKGKTTALYTNPLERYFELHPDARPKSELMSTACWRGYVATWEISDQRLWLTKVDIGVASPEAKNEDRYERVRKDVLDSIFPKSKRVLATWYSGALIVPQGEQVQYVHMGYGSTYERYSIYTIKEGSLQKERHLSLEEFKTFRKQQFERFKATEEYKKALADCKKADEESAKELGESEEETFKMDDAMTEGFLSQFYAERYLSMEFDPPEAYAHASFDRRRP
jgi:hypothetical protein